MSLSKRAEKKISNIKRETKLSGFYKYKNKKEAISVINRYQDCLNNDGSFVKGNIDANCDPRYQQLSAAIDFYMFDVIRPMRPNYGLKKKIKK
tara:strand:+ start:200 stop:478 length:279 start_codon:yes stop_codon:yes gene_type:complete